jgi:redox-sensitive bicupin YhaK (pirin superfamily)
MTQTTDHNIDVVPGENRGSTQMGWLHSRHSFSFGQYYDPDRVSFHGLRVINDDVISPGTGFGEHGHDNMEILTWVIDGALRHGDSLGHSQRLAPGELQAMSAGSGIRHSEYNDSKAEPARFLQVWIEPDTRDIQPRYDQRAFDADGRHNRWQLLASGRGADGALPIQRDVEMRVADLDAGASIDVDVPSGRYAYVHVATGEVEAEGKTLNEGDAFTADAGANVTLTATQSSQVIWFDLD